MGQLRPWAWFAVILLSVVTLAVAVAAPARRPRTVGAAEHTNAVIAWNARAGNVLFVACFLGGYSAQEARMFALMHVAVHDALNAISRRAEPLVAELRAAPGVSPDAAVAAASRGVMVPVLRSFSFFFSAECLRNAVNRVEAHYVTALKLIPEGRAKWRGVELGKAAAAAVLAWRADDGFDTPPIDRGFREGTAPGGYRYAPGTPYALAPHLGEELKPFVLLSSAQFRPAPPDPVTGPSYAADVNEVKRLGGDGVVTPSARSAEQTSTALFWAENPPQMWNRIADVAAAGQGLDLWQSARLFGLLNLAMADGYVGNAETEYRYRFWRPVTAIQLAATDGNPATAADPTWMPLQPTPPTPAYDSEHAVAGSAAAQAMRRFFGTDRIPISACSFTLPVPRTCRDPVPEVRQFGGFFEAATENAESRIYLGAQFRASVQAGSHHGEQIADWTVDHALRPAR